MDTEQLAALVEDISAGGAAAGGGFTQAPRYFDDSGSEIQPGLKALLPVGCLRPTGRYGCVRSIASHHRLPVIEIPEALGAIYKTTPAGKTGDIVFLRFYPNKPNHYR